MAMEGISRQFADVILGISSNPNVVLLVINVLLLVLGMVMEPGAILTLMLPVLLPIANGLGLDLVHFGVMVVLNLMIGQVTPPFGVCLFVISDVNKLKLERLYRSILPFLVPFDFNADSGNLYTGDRYGPAKRPAELRTSPVPNHPIVREEYITS